MFRFFALLIFAAFLTGAQAHAEKRVALIIANSAYKGVPRLANPANDAALVGGMLKGAGFDWVDTRLDLNQRCAIQIGGRCDPSTGHWEYGRNGAGGDTRAFNNCIGQMLAGSKK